MPRGLKRLAAGGLCALALCLLIVPAGGSTIYFMAVNDVPLELTAANMPTTVGGVLYVPYTIFSRDETGVNLGVYALYNPSKGRAMVYAGRIQLIFDIQENRTYDMDGNTYSERAMIRNATVYLPIARVCSVFRDTISYSLCSTPYGQLVRVKSASAVLDDEAFVAAASNRLSSLLNQYLRAQSEPSPSPTAAPDTQQAAPGTNTGTGAASDPPATAASEAPSAAPTPEAEPSETPGPDGEGARVYLAFAVSEETTEDALAQTLTALDAQGRQGLFLFPAGTLDGRAELVRRLVGSGQFVGVSTGADSLSAALPELQDAQSTLAAAVFCRLDVVWAEALDGDELAGEGYVRWPDGVDARETEDAGELLARLATGDSAQNYVLLPADAGDWLAAFLSAAAEANFTLCPPVATELIER